MNTIRRARTDERDRLLAIWLASVRATHGFLGEADIHELLPLVRDLALTQLELWVACGGDDRAVGFMGLDGASLEALFIDPARLRQGIGRQLLAHARGLKGTLQVDVNEQNPDALAFYLANGFEIAGRSPLDGGGRPFPLLHLRESTRR